MFDVRPVFNVIGLLVSCLGLTMLFPMALDLDRGNGHAGVFLESALITCLTGSMMYLATRREAARGLTLQQTFLLTSGVWLALAGFWRLAVCFGRNRLKLYRCIF
jgi:trk system potassium uptake protein TrkH